MLLGLLVLLPGIMFAQKNKNLTRIEIGDVGKISDESPYVKPGEFRVDFENMVYDYNVWRKNYMFFVILRDKNSKPVNVVTNNDILDFSNSDAPVKILRAGYSADDFIYIKTRNIADIGLSSCFLNVKGTPYGPYDAIEDVLPKGFVYRNNGVYSYVEYDKVYDTIVDYCVPVKANYEGEYLQCSLNGELLKFTPKNNVDYYKSHDGHYYILYNDDAMDNTLFIVDGVGCELDEVVNQIKFKFSHNGEHWIAAGENYLIVDGVYVKINSETIKDVSINNDGLYLYVVEGEGLKDKVYVNDGVLVDGVEILKLTVDNEQRFNYLFKSDKGFFYGIDNTITDFNDNIKKYYYPEFFDSTQTFTIKSDNGKHIFVYSYDLPYVVIDGMRLDCPSTPHYAVWNNKEKCFVWNAVEGTKLLVYKYKVKK